MKMKNYLSKIIVFITIIALTFNSLPRISSAATPLPADNSSSNSLNSQAIADEAARENSSDFNSSMNPYDPNSSTIVGELVNKRGKFTKQFRLANGMTEAEIYDSAVNYKKADGTWAAVDNTLEQGTDSKGNEIYKTKDNGYMNVSFGKQSDADKLVTIVKGKYEVSWKLVNEESVDTATVTPDSSTSSDLIADATLSPDSTDTPVPTIKSSDPIDPTATIALTDTPAPTDTPESTTTPGQSVIPKIRSILATKVAANILDDVSALKAKLSKNDQMRLADKSKSHISYKDTLPGISFDYYVAAEQVKESITVDQYTPSLSLTYQLNTGRLTPKKLDDGSVALCSGDNEVFVLKPLTMKDSTGNESIDVQMDIQPTDDGGYQMVITPDNDWMKNATYPVVIDPVVQTGENINNIHDTYASQKYPTTNYYTYTDLRVGYSTDYDLLYDYIQFDSTSLPLLRPGDVIVDASLNLKSDLNYDTSFQFNAHRVTASWDSTTLTWNNKPASDSNTSDYQIVTNDNGASGSWYSWDITDIARQWYTGGNYGVMINGESTTDGYRSFYSSDTPTTSYRPSVIIQYMNTAGINGAYTYDSFGAGRAGTASVNDLTGNLVVCENDIGTTGNRMPVSISHVYNTDMTKDSPSDIGYGVGWRLNYAQLIVPVTIGTTQYYRYTDDSGNEQYFYQSGSTYVDECGQNRTFAINTGSTTARYTITDKNDKVLTFDSNGRLDNISDALGNHITIVYSGSTQRITTITDGASRTYSLAYDGTSHLSSISAPGSRTISFGYTTNIYNSITSYRLTSVTYPDNTASSPMQSTYTYYSTGSSCNYNALNTMTNIDNQELDFTYTSSATNLVPRVLKMSLVSGTTQEGSRSFSYAEDETTVTDSLNDVNIYQFNQYGNTVSIKDNFGRAVYCQYYNPSSGASGGGTYGQNKMSLSSKLQEPVLNYALDSSFEAGTNWTSSLYNSGGSVSRVNDNKYYGSYSLCIINNSNAGYNCDYQDVSITKGVTYDLSAWVKTSSIVSSGNGSVIEIRYEDSAGTYHYATSTAITGTNDWTRVDVQATVPSDSASSQIRIKVQNIYCTGTSWFDCIQLEQSSIANRYNMVQNGDMTTSTSSTPDFWTKSPGCTSSDVSTTTSDTGRGLLDNNVFEIVGAATADKSLYQFVMVNGVAGDTFSFGAWAKANSVPLGTKKPIDGTNPSSYGRYFSIKVEMYEGSTQVTYLTVPFNTFSTQWQYVSGRAIATGTFDRIKITLMYRYNDNNVYFDGAQLYKEEFGQCYNYDSKGNLVTAKDLSDNTSTTTYDPTSNEPTSLQPPDCTGSDKYTTSYYAGNAKHEVKTTSTVEGVNNFYNYDSYGNVIEKDTEDDLTTPTKLIRSTAQYTTDGNYVSQQQDPVGNIMHFNYDVNYGVNKSTTDPSGQTTNYYYDNSTDNSNITMGKLTGISSTVNGVNYTNNYSYTDDLLTTITHNGFDTTMNYNIFGQLTDASAAGKKLVTNTYITTPTGQASYLLDHITFGNDLPNDSSKRQLINYAYDPRHRVSAVSYDSESSPRYTYAYAANDRLGSITDNQNSLTTNFYYDLADRPMKTVQKYSNGFIRSFQYTYDIDNCLTKFLELFGSNSYESDLTYDKDNRITTINYNPYLNQPAGTENVRYSYADPDGLGRLYTCTLETGTQDYVLTYNYQNGDTADYGAGAKSDQLSSINYNSNSSLSYTYDSCGRIKTVSDGSHTIGYSYDGLGQLVRTNDPTDPTSGDPTGTTWAYTYDAGGNILTKNIYVYTTSTLPANPLHHYDYAYDTTWKDKLVSITYDDTTTQNVTSDNIGNVTNYNGWAYTWEAGRQLQQMSNSGTGVSLQFKYNSDGLRTQKINGSSTTTYYWAGSNISHMTVGSDTLHFWYDGSGQAKMVTYDGNNYYYLYNQQGDVIGLINSTGAQVVSYTYDSWGKQLSCTGSLKDTLGATNPLRYRGYIYDTETGLYYLQTRYYSPDWGRFISSDAEYGSTGQINTSNLFAYCMNNPVNGSDMKGQSWWLVAAIVVAIVVVTVVCVVTIQPEGLLADAALADAAATTTEAVADTAVEAAAETSAETAAEASSELADEASTLGDESLADDPADCEGENCFVAGTPVMTSQGHFQIQNIKIGDTVYSENPDTGEIALKKVLQTYIHETSELVHVTVNGTTITSTPTHKFYVPKKGWTEAAQLRAGDKLLLLNGEIVIIEMVQHEILEKPVKVYNFEVQDFHTYFVSEIGILVHNSCSPRKSYPQVQDLKTGENIKYPDGELNRVDSADRVDWGRQQRGDYIKEWYNNGYDTPDGGWEDYDIHHIRPREFGGDNSFDNLTPVKRTLHTLFNSYWASVE